MAVLVAVLLGPLLVAGTAAVLSFKLLAPVTDQLRRYRVPLWLLIALIAMVPLTTLVIEAAGEWPNANGGMCPAVDDGFTAGLLIALYFGSPVVGGGALGTSLLVRRSGSLEPVAYAVAVVLVPYAIGLIYLVNAFCGAG